MSCVNIHHPEFKALAKRLNISEGLLRNIAHQYMNQEDSANFPPDDYVLSHLSVAPNIVTSPAQEQLWWRNYSTPRTVGLRSEVDAYIQEASLFFDPKAVNVKELPNDKFEVSVAPPAKRDGNGNIVTYKATPLKEQFKGKLIFAQSGTGKTSIADNVNVIDSDVILGKVLGVAPEFCNIVFNLLANSDKTLFTKIYHLEIEKALKEGKTVLTASIALLDRADAVIYNSSAEESNRRSTSTDRTGSNNVDDLTYHLKTLSTIEESLSRNPKNNILLKETQHLSDVLLTDSNFKVERKLTEAAKDLLTACTRFLANFGITVNSLSEYSSDTPLFDALNRVINASSTSLLSEGTGYAVAFMMLHSPIIKELVAMLHTNLKSVRRALRKHSDVRFSMSDREYSTINREIYLKQIGKGIAAELNKLYNHEDINVSNNWLKNIWRAISEFFLTITPGARSNINRISSYTKLIAEAISKNQKEVVTPISSKPGTKTYSIESLPQRVDVPQAFKDNPYEAEIITTLNNEGIHLAGSAAVAVLGRLLRPSENPLHDLDFEASGKSRQLIETILDNHYPNWMHIRTIGNDGLPTQTYLVLDRPFESRRDVPGIGVLVLYDKATGEKLGTWAGSNLVLNEGVKGKFLDFFTGTLASKYGTRTVNVNGTPITFSAAENAFAAKIAWQRAKDIWDYANYVPTTTEEDINAELDEVSTLQRAYEEQLLTIIDNAPRDERGNLLAPNGKPSNLSERQYAQVRTPLFKAWFGDWEKDPQHSSKVVDENGEPLIVYHHTNSLFNTFDRDKLLYNEFYFTTSKSEENIYSPAKTSKEYHIPVFLNIKTLRYTDTLGDFYRDEEAFNEAKDLKEEFYKSKDSDKKKEIRRHINRDLRNLLYGKYDTSSRKIIINPNEGAKIKWNTKEDFYIASSPNQIKSATDNNGDFSQQRNDINEETFREFDFVKPVSLKKKVILEDYDKVKVNAWNLPEAILKVVEEKLVYYMDSKGDINQDVDVSNYFTLNGTATASDILTYIKTNSTDATIRELASYLLNNLGDNGNVILTKTKRRGGPRGKYRTSLHTIVINLTSLTGTTKAEALNNMELTIIHEIAHAVTVRAIEASPEVRALIMGVFKEFKGLQSLYGINIGYAGKNVKEFISEFLGRKAFREALMAIPSNTKNMTIGLKIINFIKSILGIKSSDTFYDKADKAILKVLDMSNARDWEYVEGTEDINSEESSLEILQSDIRENSEETNSEINSLIEENLLSNESVHTIVDTLKNFGLEKDTILNWATANHRAWSEEFKDNDSAKKEREEFLARLNRAFSNTELRAEKNEAYHLKSVDLLQKLSNLRNSEVGLSLTEIREIADQCVYFISDFITNVQKDATNLLDDLGFGAKTEEEKAAIVKELQGKTRQEIVQYLGIERLFDICKNQLFVNNDIFNDEDRTDIDELNDQATLIADNFDAIMSLASTTFSDLERFSLVYNGKGYDVSEVENSNLENFNEESKDPDDVRETLGSLQEKWQIDFRTEDILNNMTLAVRQAIMQCYHWEKIDTNASYIQKISEGYYYDSKNNVYYTLVGEGVFLKTSKFGVPIRVPARDATNSILHWVLGAINYDDMVGLLQAKAEDHPWLLQLLTKLVITKGQENPFADLQSLFFGVFAKHFLPYSVVIKEDGKYKTILVNEHPALSDAVNEVTTLFKIGEHPMFTLLGVNQQLFRKFQEAVEEAKKVASDPNSGNRLHLESIDKDSLGLNLWYAAQCLGYFASPEMIRRALINDATMNLMLDALNLILNSVAKELSNKSYNPFAYKKDGSNPNYITGNLKSFLQPITSELEDVAVSSVYDSGKMYQSYVTPSYMTKMMNKFAADSESFISFLRNEYASTEWFKDPNSTGMKKGWRNSWLKQLASMTLEERQKVFKHKVLLNFNKHNYMKNMSDAEYTLSILTEYFSGNTVDKESKSLAWYRVPIMSNKPSSEFILFYRRRGDFSRESKDNSKVLIISDFKLIFDLELSRIQTCLMRAEQITDKEAFIKSFDENGKKFCFLDFMNTYLNGDTKSIKVGEQNINIHELLLKKLKGEVPLSLEEENLLNLAARLAIENAMNDRADDIVQLWRDNGILENLKKVDNLGGEKLSEEKAENLIREFVWNDTLAAMNIMQLTVTDIAYYKNAEDLLKRLAQIHAPGIRGNVKATDYEGNEVTDGYTRTFYLTDFDKVVSNVIDNLQEVFGRKLKAIEGTSLYDATKAFYDDIISLYKEINVADALGYSSPTSYRKKAFIFGTWSRKSEQTYQNLLKGNYNYEELKTAFLPLKPFVYSQINKPSLAEGAPIQTLKMGVLNKNSEYLLIMADAILLGENTGRPNLLRAIYRVMEESTEGNKTKGIDTVLFESTVKAGLMGRISLKDCMKLGTKEGEETAYRRMKEVIGNSQDGYNSVYVHEIPFEDYCILQLVTEHFKNHELAHGSLIRYIIPSDLETTMTTTDALGNTITQQVTYDFYDPAQVDENGNPVLRKLTAEEFKKEYENTVAENILESIDNLAEELGLNVLSPMYSVRDRNISLSRILQREILNSPRYGVDLLEACSVDDAGNFKIPLGDPILSKRVELLINSIIKNRINKQKIAGGPVVLVTNFGTSKELNIRFKDKKGGLLMTKKEFAQTAPKNNKTYNIDKAYKKYVEENLAGVAYYEVFAPIFSDKLLLFQDAKGNIDMEALEAANPDLLKMISYRIPTEDKYSAAPLKIVGFLPREAGEGIMMPADITTITGSDFDVDKMYLMRKEFSDDEISRVPIKELKPILVEVAKAEVEKQGSKLTNHLIDEQVNMFLSNPSLMKNTDSLMRALYNKYIHSAYKVAVPTEGRAYRNNKIIDMSYAVLTHETTADKMLNPGGFDLQKRMGYMVAAKRANPELDWKYLLTLPTDSKEGVSLKSLSYSDKNLSFIDTHILFYKLNAAAGTILGMFAVLKVAHAALEGDPMFVDIVSACNLAPVPKFNSLGEIVVDKAGNIEYEDPYFAIAGTVFTGRMQLDAKYDNNGQLIGKTLGSLVASAADAVKDPVLNLMNINSQTAGILNTLIRMGVPFEKASLFLSQKVITDAIAECNSRNISSPTRLSSVIQERILKIADEYAIDPTNNKLNYEELTEEELIDGITKDDFKAQYKTLLAFQKLSSLALAIKGTTLATRFNSISSAVGPLIVDNLITNHSVDLYGTNSSCIFDSADPLNGHLIGINEIFDKHPILEKFHRAYDIASDVFRGMPANSAGFKATLESMPNAMQKIFYGDRKLLSLFSDFYQTYLFTVNDGASKLLEQIGVSKKFANVDYFINKFPSDFVARKVKEQFPDNALINAIKTDTTKDERPILKVDIAGLDNALKDKLSNAWIDLYKKNSAGRALATMLFLYNYYRTGVAFSPKTFMSLVPSYLKTLFEAYIDTYRNLPSTGGLEGVIRDLFIRHNWDNSKLVPKLNFKSIHYETLENGVIKVSNPTEVEKYADTKYFKISSRGVETLYRQIGAGSKALFYEEVRPLGNNGEYIEISTKEIKDALNTPQLAVEQTEIDPTIAETTTTETIEQQEEYESGLTDSQIRELLIKVYLTPKTPTREDAERKILEFKNKPKLEKKVFESPVKNWMKAKLKEMGVNADLKLVNDLFKELC